LTAQGKRLIEKAAPAWQAGQREATKLLGADVASALRKAAKKVGGP
jgi:hypothetical protein